MNREDLLSLIDKAVEQKVEELSLSELGISWLPPEIGRLTNLQRLDLSRNPFMELPPEIGNLRQLKVLEAHQTGLRFLPPSLEGLKSLEVLDVHGCALSTLPPEIGKLENLVSLQASQNYISYLPPEVGYLSRLQMLALGTNQLTSLPAELGNLRELRELYVDLNRLTSIPKEIGQLSKLQFLAIYSNGITELPREMGQLASLQRLGAGTNQLRSLPEELEHLEALDELYLDNNRFGGVPDVVFRLTNLRDLDLASNGIQLLPAGIGNLQKLVKLGLRNNLLKSLPPEIGQLQELTDFFLDKNELEQLPVEMGHLTRLQNLILFENPALISPPPEIVQQGTNAIIGFLGERLRGSNRIFSSKLIVVGDPTVGKTCLLRALRGEAFEDQSMTPGIDVETWSLPHPEEPEMTMTLKTWDFGGQAIYRATHQFFLTNRSLFLLVWNARNGFERDRGREWLELIRSLAPDSPIMLVATRADQCQALLSLEELQSEYPNLKGLWSVSNTKGTGIDELKEAIRQEASRLPLMGEEWPQTWNRAAAELRSRTESYILPHKLWQIMSRAGVQDAEREVPARYLHELGDILFFQERPELSRFVFLHPTWITGYIYKVLTSPEVQGKNGVFTTAQMKELWHDLDPGIQDFLLLLMERFDMSYRTLTDHDISLVVELLSPTPPKYNELWDEPKQHGPCEEVSLVYALANSSQWPAGIPTWFIARAHRFTTNTHWNRGAVFAQDSTKRHLALIKTTNTSITLSVRGPYPQQFLSLMKDGLDLTLSRFPGLVVNVLVPCPHCDNHFNYADLLRQTNRTETVQCFRCGTTHVIVELLYGLHVSTLASLLTKMNDLLLKLEEMESMQRHQHEEASEEQRRLREELVNLRALSQRSFIELFKAEQEKPETYCPNVFVLRPHETPEWKSHLVGQKMEMSLYCQAPGCWHPTQTEGSYIVDDPAQWLKSVGPYIKKLVSVLKYAAPLTGPILGWMNDEVYQDLLKTDIELMKALVEKMPEITESPETPEEAIGADGKPTPVEGAALRYLRVFLDQKDEFHKWGGLERVLTPEGHYLWLCEEHRKEYRSSYEK